MNDLPDFSNQQFLHQFARLHVTKDYSAFLVAIAALQRGWSVHFFANDAEAKSQTSRLSKNYTTASFFRVTFDKRSRFFRANSVDNKQSGAYQIARDKGKLKFFLSRAKVNAPFGGVATAADLSILWVLHQVGISTVTVKPISGSGSRGVRLNQSLDQAAQLVRQANGDPCLIEQQIHGAEYRLHVIGERVVSALRIQQPSVVGDGASTLRHLIELEIARRKSHPVYMHRAFDIIELEKAMMQRKEHPARIVARNEVVPLSLSTLPNQANRVECLAELPSAVAEQAVKATRAIGSINNGIDLILNSKGEAFVIDMDSPGGIWYQCFPYQKEAWNLDVPNALLDQYLGKSSNKPRQLKFLDFVALKEELFRPSRKGGGVNAADFAEFD